MKTKINKYYKKVVLILNYKNKFLFCKNTILFAPQKKLPRKQKNNL